jgi:hypothetical protein
LPNRLLPAVIREIGLNGGRIYVLFIPYLLLPTMFLAVLMKTKDNVTFLYEKAIFFGKIFI